MIPSVKLYTPYQVDINNNNNNNNNNNDNNNRIYKVPFPKDAKR